jgi:hypothetical protein
MVLASRPAAGFLRVAGVSAVESKPASDGRIKTSHFFCLNRAGIFWQEVILHWGLIHRKASERSGFEVVLFGWSYFGV